MQRRHAVGRIRRLRLTGSGRGQAGASGPKTGCLNTPRVFRWTGTYASAIEGSRQVSVHGVPEGPTRRRSSEAGVCWGWPARRDPGGCRRPPTCRARPPPARSPAQRESPRRGGAIVHLIKLRCPAYSGAATVSGPAGWWMQGCLRSPFRGNNGKRNSCQSPDLDASGRWQSCKGAELNLATHASVRRTSLKLETVLKSASEVDPGEGVSGM